MKVYSSAYTTANPNWKDDPEQKHRDHLTKFAAELKEQRRAFKKGGH